VNFTINGTTTTFVGNYYEVSGTAVTKYYYAGAQRIAMSVGGAVYDLPSDQLGSTSIVVDDTQQHNLISELRYKAWGEARYTSGSTPTKYTYTGQYSNMTNFGLMYYNVRWYDPIIARFTQADTVEPDGVQGYDRYAYVNNNPVRYNDPTGHSPWDTGYWSISLTVSLSNSIPSGIGAQYSPLVSSGLEGKGLKNLCGDIALEMIYDTYPGSDAPLAQFYGGRPETALGDVPTTAIELAQQFAKAFPPGWTATYYSWNTGQNIDAGEPSFTNYRDDFPLFDQSGITKVLAQGHFLITLVTINTTTGRLIPVGGDGVGHWVVISRVAENGVLINNPFTNSAEYCSWDDYSASFGNAAVELTPPAGQAPSVNYNYNPPATPM
jgi:RHS repeat-associated protein